ncbi:MAG: ABC transporter substrate-binding protein [Bacteroidota bacterium]
MRLLWLCLALVFVAPTPASAQPADADEIPAAEAAFQDGLDAYRVGDYAEAEGHFRRTTEDFGFNARSTSALLMAAKSAYAAGDFDRAIVTTTTLTTAYPESRYVAEAQRVRSLAETGGPGGIGRVFDLGVVLPTGGIDGYLGQALFNGVRIAVDEHNQAPGGRPVRMVFRDSGGSGDGAEAAVEGVVEAGVAAIVGPLFSDEGGPAGAAAEAAGVVLVAPLATDEAVSQGRRFVFQANPTFPARGRAMARYAIGGLGLRRVGVASQTGTLGADMAGAFATEARRLGATVAFEERLAEAAEWEDLDREVGTSALSAAQAVYLPVTGRDGPRYAADALRALDALGRNAPRPLGNTEWEGLTTSRARAGRLGAVFTQDFFVAPGASEAFRARYRELSGLGQEDRLALIGYDLAMFLIAQIEASQEVPLADAIRSARRFDGVGHRFSFGGGQINEALFILGYRGGDAVLLE